MFVCPNMAADQSNIIQFRLVVAANMQIKMICWTDHESNLINLKENHISRWIRATLECCDPEVFIKLMNRFRSGRLCLILFKICWFGRSLLSSDNFVRLSCTSTAHSRWRGALVVSPGDVRLLPVLTCVGFNVLKLLCSFWKLCSYFITLSCSTAKCNTAAHLHLWTQTTVTAAQ